MQCQCPTQRAVPPGLESMYDEEERAGMNHAPGKCKGTHDVKQYKRGSELLWLCSCCYLSGDEEVK